MMTGFGNGTRGYPRSRGRMWSRTGPDRATLGIIGAVCAVAGFFTLGIVLGPAAMACGWFSLGRTWSGASRQTPALVAFVLGAIDTLLALLWLIGATTPGSGLL
ncbi:small hydrophobic protein [Streptomyces sp. NPDC049915]|uniref:small hydrophobic protein n=1 Tax=Streptomyces sp. NPDC049915 TaxID=3155510 RepID=UPI00341779B2